MGRTWRAGKRGEAVPPRHGGCAPSQAALLRWQALSSTQAHLQRFQNVPRTPGQGWVGCDNRSQTLPSWGSGPGSLGTPTGDIAGTALRTCTAGRASESPSPSRCPGAPVPFSDCPLLPHCGWTVDNIGSSHLWAQNVGHLCLSPGHPQ